MTEILAAEVPLGDLAAGAVAEGFEDDRPAFHTDLVVAELTFGQLGVNQKRICDGFWPLRGGALVGSVATNVVAREVQL